MLEPSVLARITDDLVAHGYSIHPDLASPARCAALRERALERERQGELRLAAIGRADGKISPGELGFIEAIREIFGIY